MQIEFKPDEPVTDAACKKATGKSLKEWYRALDERGGVDQKRRDAINWLYGEMGKDMWWCTTAWVEYERAKGILNKKDGRIEGYNICVTKTVAAPLEVVYAAFTDPQGLAKWYGAGVKAVVKDGGTFEDQGGNSGEYLRVRANKDLRFTWNHAKAAAPTQVDVAFAEKGKGKTGITLNHQRIQTRAEADGLRAAWSSAFEKLKSFLDAS